MMMSLAGMPCTYIMFALVNCAVLLIVLFLVPETWGKSYMQFKKEEQKKEDGAKEEEFEQILS